MARCRNCGEKLCCAGSFWKKLECVHCGYIYEHPFKKTPTHDELLDAYEKEDWDRRIRDWSPGNKRSQYEIIWISYYDAKTI